ncbi:MAG: response regulator, partial [Gammaproteobacteria bacterium]|nr:response regulator [Gammaproteobacteria bacterium]
MRTHNIWIIDDDKSIRWVLDKALSREGMHTQTFERADSILNKLSQEQPDVIITDIRMPGTSGLELLTKIHHSYPELPVIVMTAHSDLDSAVASFQGGAFEYLPKPFDIDEATALVKRAIEYRNEQTANIDDESPENSPEIIGEAPAMQEVFRAI